MDVLVSARMGLVFFPAVRTQILFDTTSCHRQGQGKESLPEEKSVPSGEENVAGRTVQYLSRSFLCK